MLAEAYTVMKSHAGYFGGDALSAVEAVFWRVSKFNQLAPAFDLSPAQIYQNVEMPAMIQQEFKRALWELFDLWNLGESWREFKRQVGKEHHLHEWIGELS